MLPEQPFRKIEPFLDLREPLFDLLEQYRPPRDILDHRPFAVSNHSLPSEQDDRDPDAARDGTGAEGPQDDLLHGLPDGVRCNVRATGWGSFALGVPIYVAWRSGTPSPPFSPYWVGGIASASVK